MINKNNKTIIKKTTIIIGEKMDIVQNIDISINGDRIFEIKKNIDNEDAKIINGENFILCPSFTNAHIHIDDSVLNDMDIGQSLEKLIFPNGTRDKINTTKKNENKKAIIDTINQIKRTGIGLICSFCEDGISGAKLIQECLDKNIKTILIGRFKNKFPYDEDITDLLKITQGFAPGFIRDICENDLKKISKKVKKTDGFIAMHSLESKNLPIKNFYKTVDYLKPKFLVHLVQASEKEIKYIKGKNIGIICCPRGNSITGVGIPPIIDMINNNIIVALGTDNLFLNSPDMFREMDYTSRLLRGSLKNSSIITSKLVLQMATINGAKILGQDKLYGSISINKKANFILFNKKSVNFVRSADYISTIVHRATPEDIIGVYLNGNYFER